MTSIDLADAKRVEAPRRDSGLVARLRAALARRKTYTRTLRELASLNDRELSDIGISRADIRQVAAEAAA